MQKNNIIIIVLMLAISVTTFAQSTTNSPYSKYGIGVLRSEAFAYNFGMGGVGIGLTSARDINLQNPASYAALTNTTFDAGFTNNALWLDDGKETQYQNNPYINHISLAFPMIRNVWGMSFGAMPYSNVGYDYDQVVSDPIAGDISVYDDGFGALNKVYLGNALAAKIDSTSNISFGANAYFLFGSLNYNQRYVYGGIANSYNILRTKSLVVSDFGFDVGLQYKKTFTNTDLDKYHLTVGLTYDLATDLSAKRSENVITYAGADEFISNNEWRDTTVFDKDIEDVVQLPSQIGFGVSFEKENKWLVAVDYKTTNWGAIPSNSNLFSYKSNYSLALGGQLIPKHDGSNYIGRVAYRLGTRFSNSSVAINNTDWTEYGITFGLGLPVRRAESSYPRLNFGFEYGNRGTTDAGLIKEKFFNFNVGITINALWFRKRKYD